MPKIAIDYNIPASITDNQPAQKGVVFQYLSRVPSVGEYVQLDIYDPVSQMPLTLVYPVWRVTHYLQPFPQEKDDIVALIHIRLTVEGPQ